MSNEPQTSTDNPQERRNFPRKPIELPILFQTIGVSQEEIVQGEGRLLDLSIGGAAFSGPNEFPMNTRLRLQIPSSKASFKMPEGFGELEQKVIKGKVVNRSQLEDGNWRYGVQFDKLYYTLTQWVVELTALKEASTS